MMGDLGLRMAVGRTLDIRIRTTRWDGKPRVAMPIFTSNMAELLALDAGADSITDLRGLEYAAKPARAQPDRQRRERHRAPVPARTSSAFRLARGCCRSSRSISTASPTSRLWPSSELAR